MAKCFRSQSFYQNDFQHKITTLRYGFEIKKKQLELDNIT